MPAPAAISLNVAGRPIEAMTRSNDTARTIERLPWRGNAPSVRIFGFCLRDFVGRAIRLRAYPIAELCRTLCPTRPITATGSAWTEAGDSAIIENRNECRKMHNGAGPQPLYP
jgi:hypothetical protein